MWANHIATVRASRVVIGEKNTEAVGFEVGVECEFCSLGFGLGRINNPNPIQFSKWQAALKRIVLGQHNATNEVQQLLLIRR